MSIFRRARDFFAPKALTDSAQIRQGSTLWSAFGGTDGAPSEAQVMGVTAVSACVDLIGGAIASLPMHVYRRSRQGDLTRDVNNDLWWTLNEEFHPRWTASAGWSFLAASKLLHGDGFAEIKRDNLGRIRALVPLHPVRVKVIASPDGDRLIYEVQPDPTITRPDENQSRIRVIDQADMLHIPGAGFNGLRGMSALRHSLRDAGSLAINAQTFSKAFLENMARPDYALKTDKGLTEEQFTRLQDSLDGKYRGPMNGGKPMILEGGLSIQPLTMPLEEMQLLETRKFQVEEIARAFGVQPFMIGHTEKTSSWGTGVEAMGAGFVRYTLRSHLNAFQNEINRKFFRTASRCAEFDTTELERGDTKAIFEAVRIGLGRAGEPAVLTIEEARHMLRLPRQMSGTVPQNAPPVPAPPADDTTTPDDDAGVTEE